MTTLMIPLPKPFITIETKNSFAGVETLSGTIDFKFTALTPRDSCAMVKRDKKSGNF